MTDSTPPAPACTLGGGASARASDTMARTVAATTSTTTAVRATGRFARAGRVSGRRSSGGDARVGTSRSIVTSSPQSRG